jgi:hypothetical protein
MSWLGTAGESHPFVSIIVLIVIWITSGYFTVVLYGACSPNDVEQPAIDPGIMLGLWPLPIMLMAVAVCYSVARFLANNAMRFGASISK